MTIADTNSGFRAYAYRAVDGGWTASLAWKGASIAYVYTRHYSETPFACLKEGDS